MSTVVSAESVCVDLGRREIVCDVSFSASQGDLVAILGPNGSGKSTLVRAIMGLVPLTSGTLKILGQSPGDASAGLVGYVPQIRSLDRTFPARAVELVASARRATWPGLMREYTRDWSLRALEQVGAQHLADRQVSQLSGGELQRVYLAKAIGKGARLLILDEPESGIDATGTSDLYSLLDRYCEESSGTVLLVTHDWDAAVHHATNVLLLKGRQISFGNPKMALREDHVRAAFGHVGHAHGVQTG